MSRRKKQKETITNLQILSRLDRLGFLNIKPDIFLAFVGLNLVARGKVVTAQRAASIIKKSHLNLKLKAGGMPTENILEGLIYMVVYKRELLNDFFTHREYPVWNDEVVGPIFDILYELSRIYKI